MIETLGKEDRGVLGLNDLLTFRLFCSADRAGNVFNLQRALSKHGDPKAPTEGSVRDIAIEEMREISQKTFQIFESQYINTNKNLFDLIDNLSLVDLAGQYHEYVEEKIGSRDVKDPERIVAELKSRTKAFVTYQLGTELISSGVGCGYYDQTGKEDKKGIKGGINDYLFDGCFDPSKSPKNYEHFIDYLLINFARTFAVGGEHNYVPHVNEFTKVLDRERLAEYWRKNGSAIRALDLTDREKDVVTVNYTASYKGDLAEVYKVLDKIVEEVGQ